MSKIADIIKKFLNEFLQLALGKAKEFFSKPNLLIALQVAALALVTPLIAKLKAMLEKKLSQILDKSSKEFSGITDSSNITDDDVKDYVNLNKDLQNILKYAAKDLDESLVSDAVLACGDPNYYEDKAKQMLNNLAKIDGGISDGDYIRFVQSQSDFDDRTDSFNLSQELQSLMNKVNGVLPWVFLVYIIILKVKEFLTQNEYPSPYRGKYLQKLLRMVSAILKAELNSLGNVVGETKEGINEIKGQINSMLDALKSIDAIIVASLMASFVYIQNRRLLQKQSLEAFAENASALACDQGNIENSLSDEETSVESEFVETDINSIACPNEIEEPLVPHEPFENKININRLEQCEINEGGSATAILEGNYVSDLATKAIVENLSKNNFNIFVKVGQQVTDRTVLGVIKGSRVYSPVSGIVTNVERQKVTISEIKESDDPLLNELINKVQDLYKELNDTEFFLKDFYIDSWYPVMINNAKRNDIKLKRDPITKILLPNEILKLRKAGVQRIFGGMWKQFESIKKSGDRLKESYENRVKSITGENNVKSKAQNESLEEIKKELDVAKKTYFNSINQIGNTTAINRAKITLVLEDEYNLIEYYFDLLQDVLEYHDQNNVIIPFRDELSSILTKRYFIDGWNRSKLQTRVNTLCEELSEGSHFDEKPGFFNILIWLYNRYKKIKLVEDYTRRIGKNNKELSEDEKEKLVQKVLFLFNFVIEIIQLEQQKYSIEQTPYKATSSEANFISNYFNTKWKRYKEIPDELENVFNTLDDLGNTLTTYSIININDDEYRYYAIGEERSCEIPTNGEADAYQSPFSTYEYKDIQYWLKYCAFATLTGMTNPLGWSTGFPPPIGPIPFPVIYIPIKAFQLNWGFIVIGISITGIYPFPWVLFANLSVDYHVPLADPTGFIKKNINAVKTGLIDQIKNFRKVQLKGYMEESKSQVDKLADEIEILEERKRINRTEKPKRDREIDNSALIYASELARWNQTKISIQEQLTTKKTQKFGWETKYKITYDAYSGAEVQDTPDPKIKSLKKSEETIEKTFSKLDVLINSINKFLSPLPISTQPVSANFAFTLKNPKPIINFGTDLNKTVNSAILDPIVSNFQLKKEDLMNSNYSTEDSALNWKKYMSQIQAALPFIIISDPFPKYENLKLSNLPWISFLFKDWAPIGAQTYGFPGFNPLPIG